MKKLTLLIALCALTMAANATTYNYLCAITEISVDTLASTKKNQYTLNWTQKCKNTAEYDTKPEGTYTTTVKLVINSDDRTLEGTYTTIGADPDKSSANVNDQTIGLVTSELYYGNTRRLLRSDSVSTFTIIKIDDTHYAISEGRLCFTAAALQDRNKHTYNYNYCYAEDEILTQGIEPKPYVFGFSAELPEEIHTHYDMTVNGVFVERNDNGYGTVRYFLTLNCEGTNRTNGSVRNYEVQLEILQELIKRRFGIDVRFSEGRIAYRETIAKPVYGAGHYEPLRHYAEVHLLLEPLPRGSGMQFDTAVSEDVLARNWQRLIMTHFLEKEHVGTLTGAPITDMRITIQAGRAHEKHTEGGDFRQATYRAIRQGLRKSLADGNMVLLEPWYEFELEVPQEMVGRAMSDVQRMSGSCNAPEGGLAGDLQRLTGRAPVSEMKEYVTEVASYTK
jgi:hypothetical protein